MERNTHNYLLPKVISHEYNLDIDWQLLGEVCQYLGIDLDTIGTSTIIFRKDIRGRPSCLGLYYFNQAKIRIAIGTCARYLPTAHPSPAELEKSISAVLVHEFAHLHQDATNTPNSVIDNIFHKFYGGHLLAFSRRFAPWIHRLILTFVYSQGLERQARDFASSYQQKFPQKPIVKFHTLPRELC